MEEVLSQLHQELEKRVRDPRSFNDNASIIKEIVGDPDLLDQRVLQLIRAEISVFQFVIKGNELKPMFVWTDKNGMPTEEPDIKNLSDEQIEYLITRQTECEEPILKARYSHILWLSRAKRIEFAKDAVDAYLKLVLFYSTNDLPEHSRDHWLAFLEAVGNLVPLAASVNYKIDEVKSQVIKHALTYPLESQAGSIVRKRLAELMHEQKNIFLVNDFSGIANSLQEAFDSVKGNQFHHAVEILETTIAIEQKVGNDVLRWKRLVAEMWEKIARERGVGAAIVTTNFCMKAILAYEEIGNQAKVDELYNYYEELRKNVELADIPIAVEAKELFDYAEKLSALVASGESSDIIKFLMADKQAIPRRSDIEKNGDDGENAFLKDVHSTVFDQQGNTNRHYSTGSEKDIEQLIFGYTIWMQHTFQIIHGVIVKGIKSRKLTYDIVLRYLIKESWYGQELEMGKRKDERQPFRWLSIIAPGIVDFFVAMEGLIYSNKVYNVATSFDSLTMKIEGILRTLAEYRGIHTFVIRRDNLGREISEEKDIMRLLTEPKLVEFLGEDEVFFLRYLFTEKGGLNLRNKVAHSLMSYEQYSIAHLMFVFVAVLRLGRFTLRHNSNNPENETT